MMKFTNPDSFFLLVTIDIIMLLYIILLGIAPGVKPLTYTKFFLYGPGLGFFWLVGGLALAIALQFCRYCSKIKQRKLIFDRLSWTILLLLSVLECVMIADFHDILL
jgi:hypothetical protein